MFSLHDYVLKTILGMVGNEPDYKIQEYSLNWYNKSILKDDDLATIENAIEGKNKPVEVPKVIDETLDNSDESIDNVEIEEKFDIEEVTPEEDVESEGEE